jgi:phosphoribosylformylglycinamidine (FGAM) synthase-like enzyme
VARKVFEKWALDFAVIGIVTDTGRVVLKMNGKTYADIPSDPLSEAAPEYDRPWK